jgi:dTDP-4-amino-4,6-dideoxygalactose transaminase
VSAWRVPFNRPAPRGRELEYMAAAAHSGHLSGDGEFTRRCQAELRAELGAPCVLLTTSCTHALELAALLLDLAPGDEVILPAFSFVSTANAFALHGATPVFADVRRDTLNLDPGSVERLLSPRTRAIVPVHYAGVGCEMEALGDLAERCGAMLIEDNAMACSAPTAAARWARLALFRPSAFTRPRMCSVVRAALWW